MEYFLEKAPDLMNREYEREGVKLHATVMNSKFPYTEKKDAVSSGGYKGSRPRDSFDARGVFRVSNQLGTFYILPYSHSQSCHCNSSFVLIFKVLCNCSW